MEKLDAVKHILRNTNHGQFINSSGGFAWAPSNVALCKYWGKRDQILNLPVTSSLSISLGNKGASTLIKQEGKIDEYFLNGAIINSESKFATRLANYLNLFRPHGAHYLVNIDTNVPIAAGMASSACGFASLAQALNQLYDWRLSKKELSILARLGSGSAARSLWEGFVEWQKGESYDGMDSFATKLDYFWPELRVGALIVSDQAKPISSTQAMAVTVKTSPLYTAWPMLVAEDLNNLHLALARKDFSLLGQTAENNALAMHALMRAAEPAINYILPETEIFISLAQELRSSGIPIYFTQDAGPNLQLLFLARDIQAVLQAFPDVEIILPFADRKVEHLTLVNEDDIEIGEAEKFTAHIQGKLHRAFSVFVLRKHNDRIEILMQQRSAQKYHSASLWTNTCCGHPRPGEEIIAAAERRLREEMGFSVSLHSAGKFHYIASFPEVGLIENEIDHVLVGFTELDAFNVNRAEVQNYCWLAIEELAADLQLNPQKYTAWLAQAVEILLQQH